MTTSQAAKWFDLRKQADARAEALKLLLAIGGAGLGAGALARGVIGANSAMAEPAYDPLMHTSSVPTPLPVPIYPAPKKKKLQALPAPTLAKAAESLRKHAEDGWLQGIANAIIPQGLPGDTGTSPPATQATPAAPAPPPAQTQPNPLASRWGVPAATLAAGAGLLGGWHLMGAATNNTKTDNVDAAVQSAEEDYQQALAEQYRAALRAKNGEDNLGIDDLYDAYVKRAEEPSFFPRIPLVSSVTDAMMWPAVGAFGPDQVNKWRGAVDAATLATTLGAGYLTHNWVKKRNTNKILDKAVQLRARQRQFTPAPFYAVPERIAGGA